MLHAVTTFKDLTRLCIVTSVCVACRAADSSVGPAGPPPHLTMDVRYLSTLTAQQQSVVTGAVDKWTRALSKDFGDFQLNTAANKCFSGEPQLNEIHHNPLIFISVAEVDGFRGQLAFTQICSVSGRDTLPILSHIRFDRADLDSLEAKGLLTAVMTHEIGHAIGFNPASYMLKMLGGGGTDNPYFSGASARTEFARHGAWYTGVSVPLENASGLGPKDPHWRFVVFGDELMTSAVGRDFKSPLSTITLGLFKDLGYEVDFSVADPYEVRPLFGGNRVLPQANLVNDFRSNVPPTVVSPLGSH